MNNDDNHHDCECEQDDCPEVYDYVIVGAGTAGAPLAKLLSDDFGVSVFVGEGGGDTRQNPEVLDRTAFPSANPALTYCYPADFSPYQPIPTTQPGPCLPEGEGLGGDSLHNFMLAVQGTPCLYDEWAKISGCARWRYENLLPSMRYIERYTPLATGVLNPDERGTKGPLFVTQVPESSVIRDSALVQAFASKGAPYSLDYNDPTRGVFVLGDGQVYQEPTPPNNRSWAASAFLGPDVLSFEQENGDLVGVGCRQLRVGLFALADRVLFDDEVDPDSWSVPDHRSEHRRHKDQRHGHEPQVPKGKALVPVNERGDTGCDAITRARGVRFIQNGRVRDVIARKKVILSAGGVGDVGVLVRSGIGPLETLQRLGIEPRICNENVGRNMQNHNGPFVIMPTTDTRPQGFVSFFAGPESEKDGCRDWQTITTANFEFPGVVVNVVFILRPARNGEIVVQNTAVSEDALFVDFHFMEDPDDVATIVRVLKELGRISIAASGSLPILPPAAFYPASEFAAQGGLAPDDSFLIEYAKGVGITSNHTSGTARMARCPEDGVVDKNLDVFGAKNLGIADNAVIPSILDGNTAWGAYVVGVQKAAIEGAPVPFCFDPSCDDSDCDCHDHDHH